MPALKVILMALVGLFAGAVDAFAADPPRCLSPQQRRDMIAAKQAIPLSQALRAVRKPGSREVVRAQLCESDQGLVYMLTVLSPNGRVRRVTVDAANGNLLKQ